MKIFAHRGKKTALIHVFIDPERGFVDATLTENQGGALYVPEGEQVPPLMGGIIARSRDAVFVIGQDYHPANHISFMVNHPGVMEHRAAKFRALLAAHGEAAPSAEKFSVLCQQPVHVLGGKTVIFPFEELVLDENRDIFGLKEPDGGIRRVKVATSSGLPPAEEDRGRVTEVFDGLFPQGFDAMRAAGALLTTQTLWTRHCVQGTDSSLYPDSMKLPGELKDKLDGDLMSPSVHHRDAATGNEFFVIRKGAGSEVDSYGIGVENDGETMTAAWDVFRSIAHRLKKQGCERVIVAIGGLATNFCVEFSANNVVDFLAGHFKMRGMEVEVKLIPEISRGIPVPGGAGTPFSLAGAPERLKASRNVGTAALQELLSLQEAAA
jgi:nicotinamidase-related amidase